MPAQRRDLAAGLPTWLGMAGWTPLGPFHAGFSAAASPAALAVDEGAGISRDVGPAQPTPVDFLDAAGYMVLRTRDT